MSTVVKGGLVVNVLDC